MTVPSFEISPRIRSREGERATQGSRSDGWMILSCAGKCVHIVGEIGELAIRRGVAITEIQ